MSAANGLRPGGPQTALDRECLRRLKAVRFEIFTPAARRSIVAIENRLTCGDELTPALRLDLYAACWRQREAIGDPRFTARVMIAERLLLERDDVEARPPAEVRVRGWRAPDQVAVQP